MLAQSDVYYWNYYPNTSKTEPNGVSKQKKKYPKDKFKNDKYPDVKNYGSRSYEWMVLL